MERWPLRALFVLSLSAPASAIGPDPIVEEERHRVSALMIQAHLEAANNSTVEGARRAKEENDIIPQVSASQSLAELQKDEMILRRNIAAAEKEVPNIEGANTMPESIRLDHQDTYDVLASGPRWDGHSTFPLLPADALEPALDRFATEELSNPAGIEKLARADNAIASFSVSGPGSAGDAVAILRPEGSGWAGRASSSRIERGSFQLEVKSPDMAFSAFDDPGLASERNRIIFE